MAILITYFVRGCGSYGENGITLKYLRNFLRTVPSYMRATKMEVLPAEHIIFNTESSLL